MTLFPPKSMKFTYKSMILVFTFSIFDVKITTVDIIQCHFALVKASDKKERTLSV